MSAWLTLTHRGQRRRRRPTKLPPTNEFRAGSIGRDNATKFLKKRTWDLPVSLMVIAWQDEKDLAPGFLVSWRLTAGVGLIHVGENFMAYFCSTGTPKQGGAR